MGPICAITAEDLQQQTFSDGKQCGTDQRKGKLEKPLKNGYGKVFCV
jgi:hypothetical protein